MADRVRRCQNDHRAARSAHPSLRHRRDRQRELAVQESKLSTVTTGAKGDVVLGYDGSGLRPPPSYPRTTMRWWSPFTCRSRSPLPRRLTNWLWKLIRECFNHFLKRESLQIGRAHV